MSSEFSADLEYECCHLNREGRESSSLIAKVERNLSEKDRDLLPPRHTFHTQITATPITNTENFTLEINCRKIVKVIQTIKL